MNLKSSIWKSGIYGAFTHAFDMGRELAPSILCFEDVDSWMDRGSTLDLLKTEMDGMARSSGVVTLLTTNYPEQIPEALIDRPGRFHDVLLFDLPDRKTRESMLAAWLPEATAKDRAKAADRLDGYSGAHVYELCCYAKTIREEDDSLSVGDALIKAVEKIEEQRELINGVQLEGSHYKPTRSAVTPTKAFAFGNKTEGVVGPAAEVKGTVPGNPTGGSGEYVASVPHTKSGRALSKANEQRIKDARDDVAEIIGIEGISRAAKALATGAAASLNEVLRSVEDEDEDGGDKETTCGRMLAWLAAAATAEELEQVSQMIRSKADSRERSRWRRFVDRLLK